MAMAKKLVEEDEFEVDLPEEDIDELEDEAIAAEADDELEDEEEDISEFSERAQKRIKELARKNKDLEQRYTQRDSEYRELEDLAYDVAGENERLRVRPAAAETPKKPDTSDIDKRIDSIKTKAKAAFEDGDADEYTKLISEIPELIAEKKMIEVQAQNQNAQPQQHQEQPRPVRVHPRVSAWADRNPWFKNPDNNAAILHASFVAGKLEKRGLTPSSDEYFKEIDAEMHQRFPELFEKKPKDGNPAPVTPVSRANTGAKPKKGITLTPFQVRYAKQHNIPMKEMAKQVARMKMKEVN